MNILIIGINYAPEQSGSAPYTSGLAEKLAESGHVVHAIAGIPHYPSWTVKREDKFRLRHRCVRKNVRVTHFRHFVPKRQTPLRRILWEFSFFINVFFYKLNFKPEIIFVSVPNLSAGLLGVRLAHKYRVPLITIVQDLVGNALSLSQLSVGKYIRLGVTSVEKLIYLNSTKVAVISRAFMPYIQSFGLSDSHIFHFPNWSHVSKATKNKVESREFFGFKKDCFTILYTGNLGLKQSMENLICVANMMSDFADIHFVICGDGNQKEKLVRLAANSRNVKFMEPVESENYSNLLIAADLLLVIEGKDNSNMSLPSKITSYLHVGMPILALVDPKSASADELRNTNGAAKIVSSECHQEAVDTILALKHNPQILKKMSVFAKQYSSSHLSLETSYNTLIENMKDSLS